MKRFIPVILIPLLAGCELGVNYRARQNEKWGEQMLATNQPPIPPLPKNGTFGPSGRDEIGITNLPIYVSPEHKDAGMVLPAKPHGMVVSAYFWFNPALPHAGIQYTQSLSAPEWSTGKISDIPHDPTYLAWTDTTPRMACFYRAVNLP